MTDAKLGVIAQCAYTMATKFNRLSINVEVKQPNGAI